MRKYKAKQISNYIALFRKISEGVYQSLGANPQNLDRACVYLETCQQRAIDFGTFIEDEEGEGHPTVKLLEEFCEIIYQIHEDILSERGLSADSAKGRMDRIINQIEESANKDIRITKLTLFLPYKASMWDSLESVWLRDKEDPDCEAIVIPIPYFDKNPDGSVKEMHYEGNDYPEDVPIVSFEEFDFVNAHPDEVYIHNPYDDMNYVTSVHPFFYSENIKKFTEKLIYIPYFVLAEPDVDNEDVIDGIAGYAVAKGVINADEVIVQSEQMKEAYVRALTKRFGLDSRKKWEDKIKGTGSPKFDKLLRMAKEEQDIPEDWKKIITKPDGTKKKIVFYNTSLVAMLNGEQKMVDKIKDVLEVFKECKDDVALLWRPHPLIIATLDSMVPEVAQQYRDIVDVYKKEGWGIYDDTPDMDRAIIISDAYYGDASSIVQLYEKLEKPIMIQNVEVLEKESV